MMKKRLVFCLLFMILMLSGKAEAGEYPQKTIDKALKFAAKTISDKAGMDADAIEIESLVSNHASSYYSVYDTLFKIINGSSETLGYLIISSAKGRFDFFDFMMVYKPEKNLNEIRILTYRSEYGSQVTSKKWLQKFCEISPSTNIEYGVDIDAVSGATFSASSLCREVNRINKMVLEIK